MTCARTAGDSALSGYELWLWMSGATLLLLAATAALGSRPERLGVLFYLVAWALTVVSDQIWPDGRPIEGALIADVFMLVVFAGLAWKSDRLWPALALGPQAVLVALHLVWAHEREVGKLAFAAALNTATFSVLLLMLWGAGRARAKRRAEAAS